VTKYLKPGWLLGVIAVVLALGGTATASSLITSGNIKDGTIKGRDIKSGTITTDKLSHGVQTSLKKLGAPGPQGPKGDKGDAGATTTLQGSAPRPGESAYEVAKDNGFTGTQAEWLESLKGKPGLEGAFYAVAKYNVGDTNAGAIATVACNADNAVSQQYVAVSGGVQTIGLGTNGISNNTPVSSSFPGRMDWNTNTPKAGRLDGWIVQFGGNAQSSGASDKDPRYVNVWALCVKNAVNVPTHTTFTEDGSEG
jgi:hypothetical protein